MLNEAHYEQDWQAQGPAPERPHMESNRWLNAAKPTVSSRTPQPVERETIDVFGVKLVWTKDRGKPFPAPILDTIKTLLDFAQLPEGWNSYKAQPLNIGAVPAVLDYVVRAYQLAQVPRLLPLPDGGVGLIWQRGARELELSVAANGLVEGLLTFEDADEIELPINSTPGAGMELLEQYLAAR
jgi:hypothetical protein